MGRPLSQTDVYKAISDSTRRALLRELSKGEKSVTELLEPFEMTMPALSRHLQVLREVDLVKQERSGKQHIYYLNAKPLQEVSEWLIYFERFWDKKLDGLALYLADSEKGKSPQNTSKSEVSPQRLKVAEKELAKSFTAKETLSSDISSRKRQNLAKARKKRK